MRIAGSKGVVEYQGGNLTLITRTKKPHTITDLPRHAPLFADFLDAIYNNKKHLIPLEDIYRVTEIVLRSREAAESNRTVRI